MAAEDIGLADPNALVQCMAAKDAAQTVAPIEHYLPRLALLARP